MRAPASLRVRVALAAGAAIALATVLLGITAVVLSEREAASSRDAALRAGATQVAQLSASAPALLTAPGALEGRLGGRRLLVEVVDRRGRIVARSASLGGGVLGTPAEIAGVIASGHARYSKLPTSATSPCASTARRSRASARGRRPAAPCSSRRAPRRTSMPRTGCACSSCSPRSRGTARDRYRAGPDAPRAAPADRPLRRGPRDRRHRRRHAAAPGGRARRGRRALRDAQRDARLARAGARGRAPLRRRRLARAAHAAHGAARQRRLHRPARRRRRGARGHRARRRAASRLLDDLLALAREDAAGVGTLEPVRLDQLALARAGGRVAVDAPGPVTVRGDPEALARALGNLVENALVHGRQGGPVTMAVLERGPGARDRARRRAGRRRRLTRPTRSSASGARPQPMRRPARDSASRSSAQRPSVTAAGCRLPARRSRSTFPVDGSSRVVPLRDLSQSAARHGARPQGAAP